MSHFLFIAGALRERSSEESAELQLSRGLWGLCTSLIRTNLQTFVEPPSRGLIYVLKIGLCADVKLVAPVQEFSHLDDFLKDEFRTEARFGFIRIEDIRRCAMSSSAAQTLLANVLRIPGQAELARRFSLGMHRLTQGEYEAIVKAIAEWQDR
jgi:hypothetical protein